MTRIQKSQVALRLAWKHSSPSPAPLRPTHCPSPLSLVPVLSQAALDRCKGGSPTAPGVKSQHESRSAWVVKECWGRGGLGGSSGTDRVGWLSWARNAKPNPMVPKSFRCGIGWREGGKDRDKQGDGSDGGKGDQNSELVGVHPRVGALLLEAPSLHPQVCCSRPGLP